VERSQLHLVIVVIAFAMLLGTLMALSPPAEAAPHGVKLGFAEPGNVKVYQPPDLIVFNLTVEHTGDELTDEIIIRFQSEPSGWSHVITVVTNSGVESGAGFVKVDMDVGEVASLMLTVKPSSGMANRTYWLTLVAYANKQPTANDTLDLGVVITQEVDFEIVTWDPPPDKVYEAMPPAEVTVRFAVYNLGNGADSFLLQVESSLCDAGWIPVIVSGVDGLGWTPDLQSDPDRKTPHFVDVTVIVPAGEPAGITCFVAANATSRTNQTKERAPAGVSIRALQYYGFRVTFEGENEKGGHINGTVRFQMWIQNRGNGADTFRIFAAWDEKEAPGWTARPDPTEVTLLGNTSALVDFLVKVPLDAPRGVYQFSANVWSTSSELAPVTKNFKVTVLEHYDLEMTSEVTTLPANPGDQVRFTVAVRNTGNAIDSFDISWSTEVTGWISYIQPPSQSLLPDEVGYVNITVLVPMDLGADPLPMYIYDLLAESVASDAEALLALMVEVNPYGRIEWLHQGEMVTSPDAPVAANATLRPKPVIDIYNGTTVAFSLILGNVGIIDDNVTFWGYTEDDRINVSVLPVWKVLARGQEHEAFVQISVPEYILPGEHRVWINASSKDPNVAMRAVALEFDVVPIYYPQDFQDQRYDDLLGDDFAYTYEIQGDRVVSSRGHGGRHSEFDIVSLVAVLDLSTNTVTLTIELKGPPDQDRGVFYAVYFVTEDHQVIGGLVDPESHKVGDLVWETHDEANTIAFVYLSDQLLGSSVPMQSLDVDYGSDRVVFTMHARDLRKAGVDPGSDFQLYAYCHELGSVGGEGAKTRLIYDTAGKGAVDGPYDFTNEPEETSNVKWVAVGVAVIIALALLFLYFLPRLLPPEPEPEPTEADSWVEYK
jgi:uncharacterized membrane protein